MDWDTTKNLYIEGDNLEVLKLLQRSYHGKVKMIYIDPPYNTGNDFVYNDKFDDPIANYKQQTGQESSANPETDGRYHSNWCNMMYPRLRLARELLSDDGVIFISIDDIEAAQLRKICDEIFGESNFVSNFIWEKRTNRENRKTISSRHDNILCYQKSNSSVKAIGILPMNKKALSNYSNPDNDPRGPWKSDPATAQAGHGTKSQFYILEAPNGKKHELPSGRCWVYSKESMESAIRGNKIWFGKDGNGVPRIKTYLYEKERGLVPESILFASDVGSNETAKNAIKKLFDEKAVFDTPKPVGLLETLTRIGSNKNAIILDFFSGSATTAHAAMRLNSEDGGHRRFILVQLPEKLDEQSEAAKTGYRTLCDIGEERIRRAGQKIKAEVEEANRQPELDGEPKRVPDIGFRVLSLDSSNIEEFDAGNGPVLMDSMVKEDRSKMDVLFEVMLKWGLDLSLPVEPLELDGYTCWSVAKGELVCCMDEGLTVPVLERIAALEERPRRVLILDSVLDDTLKLNAESIFGRAMADGDEIELRTV